ncbi:DUF5412 family protein [Falsibacillus pallidus]|uniref:Uncharacterized protein n=1 Tax=Falsibacillus pallidus TaxID=493781 RepID=A0A370GSU0_9BACI|nr:DUF5412 family protein [Falsibacillus pallidus]RDI45594.1 hypothetical protein DFR59_102223 [Falsibacillus pallidus]
MSQRYNLWSFYLSLLSLLFLLSLIYSDWSIAPPYIFWFISVISFILGIIGFKDKTSRRSRFRSWFTVILSLMLSGIFFLGVIRFLFISEELIKTAVSPDDNYKVEFYLINGGAATSFSVLGKLDGPLWLKKTIYYQSPMDHADVKWVDNHTISINNQILNIKEGDTYSH